MTKEAYVLIEDGDVIGVFDKPDMPREQIIGYYCNPKCGDFEVLSFEDVRDSGVEWSAVIRVGDDTLKLVMLYFFMNEI